MIPGIRMEWRTNIRRALCPTVVALTVVGWTALSDAVRAQGLSPPPGSGLEVGAAGGLKPAPTSPPLNGEDVGIKRHLGPTGKACLTVKGVPQREAINPKLFEHKIVALNDCSKRIKIRACYYQTQHCVVMDVPPNGRDEVVLGIMPSMSGFRFEFREQFDQL
jgi:hypothetical protein